MIAAKHLDPLVGVDIHITLIPTPAGPVPMPLPNPYVGMVFDPMDWLPGIGATLYINGLPRAVAGTSGQALPPHLPLVGPFAKPPTNESEIFMGSSTVVVDGDPQSFLGMPVLSCQDIGMPAPFRMKKKSLAKSLMLPTTVVLSIPMGSIVLIGGPPTISMTAMTMKGVMTGLKKLRSLQKASKGMKRLSDRVHRLGDALADKLHLGDAARNRVHKAICTVTGHPVDVATGKVLTDKVDFELPGPIALRWERTWFSASTYQGPLGRGWHHAYDEGLYVEEGVILYRTADGRLVTLPPLEEGAEYFDRAEKFTFARDEAGYVVRGADGLRHRFADVGRAKGQIKGELVLASISDSAGNAIRFHYEKAVLVELVDAGGRVLRLHQDGRGRLAAIEGPDPSEESKRLTLVRYRYDDGGNLVEVEDAKGHRARFEYQGHLLTKETDRNGLSFFFEYDGRDEKACCIHTWGDGGIYNHTLTYDADAHTTTVENSLGHQTAYHHRGGTVFKTVDALGHVTQVERNEYNEVVAETDALGLRTAREYDKRGNEVSRMAADGVKTSFGYEGDKLVEVTDAVGGTWGLEYDEKGRLAKRTNPLGQALRYFYAEKHLVGIADAAGHRTEVDFDAAGNLVEAIAPDGARSRWEYDGLGRVTREMDARANSRVKRNDVLGRVVEVQEPDGNVRRLDYDAEGNVVRVKDKHREVRFTYQGMGKVASRHEAGTTVSFFYDTEERLTGIQNEHGLVYRFQLGPTGDVDVEEGFDGRRRRFKRDKAGRVVEAERPDGRVTKYVYDVAGRVLALVQPDGSSHLFTYRADGEMVEAKNGTATVKLERDALGRVVKEFQDAHWVETEYGPTGLRVKMKSSLGAKQDIQRNEMGDVMGVRAGPFSASFERDILGLETKRAFALDRPGAPDAAWAKWERDALGRPTKQHRQGRGMPETTRFYEWDVDDRLRGVGQSGQSGNWDSEYTHDALGNLQSAKHWTAKGTDFERRMPDEVGNLFRTEDRTDREYGPAGELLAAAGKDGVTRYEYDAEGNLSKRTEPGGRQWRYEWNMAGMLVKVVRPDGGVVQFGYDALGRRMWKKFQGHLTKWVWDGNNPLHEWVEVVRWSPPKPPPAKTGATPKNGQPELWPVTPQGPPGPQLGTRDAPITWLFEPERFAPMGKVVAGAAYAIVTDQLGTPLSMYDAKGAEVWGAELGIYGHLRRAKGPRQLCPFRWPGQYEDVETGLHYNRFRYYDPVAGAYISQDPIHLEGGLAVYLYGGDPNFDLDVFGLSKSKGSSCETFVRNMSKKEAEATKAAGGLVRDVNQANEKVTRKAKWISRRGFERARTNKANTHRVVIETRPGTEDFLRKRAVDSDQVAGEAAAPGAVLVKAAEPGCFGVGIDLLEDFNSRIVSVTITKL